MKPYRTRLFADSLAHRRSLSRKFGQREYNPWEYTVHAWQLEGASEEAVPGLQAQFWAMVSEELQSKDAVFFKVV